MKPEANSILESAEPSPFLSRMIQTESPFVSGLGFLYCGPIPTHNLPSLSKVIAQGFRTRGSLANNETSKSSETLGKLSSAFDLMIIREMKKSVAVLLII